MRYRIMYLALSTLALVLVLVAPRWPEETLTVALASVAAAVFGLGDKFLA
jgi:hypothetical protein